MGIDKTHGSHAAYQPPPTDNSEQDLRTKQPRRTHAASAGELPKSALFDEEGNTPPTSALPPADSGKAEAAAALARLQALNDAQVGADIYAYMALFQQMAQQMRNTARTQRTTEMQAQVSALQNAAQEMKNAAAQRFIAALVSSGTQIVSGLVQMGGSSLAASKSIKGAKMEYDANKGLQGAAQPEITGISSPTDVTRNGASVARQATFTAPAGAGTNAGNWQDTPVATLAQEQAAMKNLQGLPKPTDFGAMLKDAKVLSAEGTKIAGLTQGLSGLVGGLGSGTAAFFTREADARDAAKMELETQARVHEAAVQHANDTMQQMMDVIRDVRDKLQAIEQATVETNRGIARNI